MEETRVPARQSQTAFEPENDSEEGIAGQQMSFLEHLDELRQRLIKIILSVLVMMMLSFAFSNEIIKFLLYPPILLPGLKPPIEMMRPVITQVQGLMMVKIQVGLIAGIIFSLPVILFQLWRFISPGLRKKERRYAIPVILFATFFFMLGAFFSYIVVIPITLNFLLSMGSIDPELGIVVENMIDLDAYLGFVSGFMLISGITFELPVLSYFLTKIGILSSSFLRKYWRHAVIGSLFISAVVTPTTDMITLFVVAVPIIVLYEVSIWVSAAVSRKKRKESS
ncbi:twin-arginine translocase subunit TatC [bacterium]|nr:twin-arginine translocase subunit TatC [bacterium]